LEYVVADVVTENRVTDPNGNVTTYRFNSQDYSSKVIDALGRVFASEIDYATNLVMSTTDGLLRTTRYTYDDRSNLTSIVDPVGNTTLIEYDRQWNKPSKLTDPLGCGVKVDLRRAGATQFAGTKEQ